MSKLFTKSRVLALVISLALVLSLFPMAVPVTAEAAAIGLSNEHFNISIGDYGQIDVLKIANDLYNTNYVIGTGNIASSQNNAAHQFMGELILAYRKNSADAYTEVDTNRSADVRTINKVSDTCVQVSYAVDADGANARGIKDFTVVETYTLIDNYLYWEIEIKNKLGQEIEIGDLGLPMTFGEIWNSVSGQQLYEAHVIDHSFVGADSSYIYATRPSGQGPFLLFTPDVSTGAQLEYQDHWINPNNGTVPERYGSLYSNWTQDTGNWANGLNVFYVHSDMIKRTGRGYLKSTSLKLGAGESKKYGFKFFAIRGDNNEAAGLQKREEEMKSTLYDENIVYANTVPGMQFAVDMKAKLDIQTDATITRLEIKDMYEDSPFKEPYLPSAPNYRSASSQVDINRNNNVIANNLKVKDSKVTFVETKIIDGEKHNIYDLELGTIGHNNLYIYYTVDGAEKYTVLQYNALSPIGDALQTHGDFMVDKTQVQDSASIGYKAFDDWRLSTATRFNQFTGGYGGWGDDWGLTHGEYLAEKNVFEPDARQIKAVDEYLDICIWNTLMALHHNDYKVDDWLGPVSLTNPNGSNLNRGYAYPHVYNTYFSMYKIAKMYPEIVDFKESRQTYLLRTYNIVNALYTASGVGYNWSTGLMGEQTTPDIIAALKEEGFPAEAARLESHMLTKYNNFKNTKYPYGSEYAYDNTGEESVYTLAKMQGNREMMQKIDWKTRACRGIQPIWYHYANPTTICGENWWNFQYTASLAGYCMDDYLRIQNGYADVNERALAERVNYAAKLANINCINMGQIHANPDNYGAVAWTYQAEKGVRGSKGTFEGGSNLGGDLWMHNGWRDLSGEADLGLFGAMRILSSDVVTDPVFGLFGYGCDVTLNAGVYTITPKDGLYKRLNLLDEMYFIEFERDQYHAATVAKDGKSLSFTVKNLTSTAHLSKLTLSGLPAGAYSVAVGGVDVGNFRSADGKCTAYVPLGAAPESTVSLTWIASAANTAPVATAQVQTKGDIYPVLTKVSLGGNASDDGYPNNTLTYQWSLESAPEGATANFTSPANLSTQVTVSAAGTYVFALTVSDGELTAKATVSMTALPIPPNQAPTVTATVDTAAKYATIAFGLEAKAQDDGWPSNTITYAWAVDTAPTGATVVFDDATKAAPKVTVSTVGDYTFKVTVSDGDLTGGAVTPVVSALARPGYVDNPSGNLRLQYSFNEPSGATVFDYSGRGRNATMQGPNASDTAGRITGYLSGGVRNNGNSVAENGNWVQVPYAAGDFQPSDITVAFWIRRSGTMANDTVLAWGKAAGNYGSNGWFITTNSTDGVYFFANSTSVALMSQMSMNTFFTNNAWTHVIVTWNSTTRTGQIFRNGVPVTTMVNSSQPVTTNNSPLLLMKNGYGANPTNTTTMDGFRLYNTDVSPEGASRIYRESLVSDDNMKELRDALSQANAIDQSVYSVQTVAVLNTAIRDGEDMLTAPHTATSETYQAAIAAVRSAIDGLIKKLTTLKVPVSSLSLRKGKTQELVLNWAPNDVAAGDLLLAYSSSNPTVASVDSTGKVLAVKPGMAVISIKALDGSNLATQMLITVTM